MPYITVNAQQAELVAAGQGAIEICDPSGRTLGFIESPVPPEEIAIAKARMNSQGPRYGIQQVLAHLQSLEER